MKSSSIDIANEIAFVLAVITHPAGYDLDLFGILEIRPTDQLVWEVSWEQMLDGRNYRTFSTAQEAAEFFVKKRHDEQIGIDFEGSLCQKNS